MTTPSIIQYSTYVTIRYTTETNGKVTGCYEWGSFDSLELAKSYLLSKGFTA